MTDLETTQTNLDDLFATEEEIQALKQAGAVETTSKASGSGGNWDPSYRLFRNANFSSSTNITWFNPLSKEQKEQGLSEDELQFLTQDLVSIRCLPISLQTGWRFATDNGSTTVCQTVGCFEKRNDRIVHYMRDQPFKMLFSSPQWGKKRPDQMNYAFPDNLEPYARRTIFYPDGSKSYETRSCRKCVAAQDYFNPLNTQEACRSEGYLLVVVFELGFLNETAFKASMGKEPKTVEWKSIEECGLKNPEGLPIDGPFVLRINGVGGRSQQKKIGKGQYDLLVNLRKDNPTLTKQNAIIYPDDVMSIQTFYDYLYNDEHTGTTCLSKEGNLIITTYTEIYYASLLAENAKKSVAPVFLPIYKGLNTEIKPGYTIREAAKTAVAVFNSACRAGGKDPSSFRQTITEQSPLLDSLKSDEPVSLPSANIKKVEALPEAQETNVITDPVEAGLHPEPLVLEPKNGNADTTATVETTVAAATTVEILPSEEEGKPANARTSLARNFRFKLSNNQ